MKYIEFYKDKLQLLKDVCKKEKTEIVKDDNFLHTKSTIY